MDDAPRRRGLGFLAPAVVIRSRGPAPSSREWHDDDEYAGPLQVGPSTIPAPRVGRESWRAVREWHINPSGHGGRSGPPVFVRAENAYDELGRTVSDGFGVEVMEGEKVVEKEEKEEGGSVADWYRSLASVSVSASVSKAASKEASPSPSPGPSTTSPASTRAAPSPAPPERVSTSSTAPSDAAAMSSAAPATPQPRAAVRVHRSEWFIRRALLSSAKDAAPPPPPPSTPSSIGSMLNIDSAKPAPPPIPRYALGPDNPGFTRLASLGWQGGGLGRPEGWTAEDEARAERARESARERALRGLSEGDRSERSHSAPAGVIDLTASDDEGPGDAETATESDAEAEAVRSGPGRTAPIATALKFNRLGLGRVPADRERRVTHTSREIEAARRRGVGVKHDPRKGEPTKKAKVKWAERDRREREHRARIAAALR